MGAPVAAGAAVAAGEARGEAEGRAAKPWERVRRAPGAAARAGLQAMQEVVVNGALGRTERAGERREARAREREGGRGRHRAAPCPGRACASQEGGRVMIASPGRKTRVRMCVVKVRLAKHPRKWCVPPSSIPKVRGIRQARLSERMWQVMQVEYCGVESFPASAPLAPPLPRREERGIARAAADGASAMTEWYHSERARAPSEAARHLQGIRCKAEERVDTNSKNAARRPNGTSPARQVVPSPLSSYSPGECERQKRGVYAKLFPITYVCPSLPSSLSRP